MGERWHRRRQRHLFPNPGQLATQILEAYDALDIARTPPLETHP